MTQLADQTALVMVRQVLDGVEGGATETLADELTRAVRASLNEPIETRVAQFLPARAGQS